LEALPRLSSSRWRGINAFASAVGLSLRATPTTSSFLLAIRVLALCKNRRLHNFIRGSNRFFKAGFSI
jgi:hypothetical protein